MIKITKTGKKTEVYDIHVKNNHNFIANGVVVHNCTEILEPTASGQYVIFKKDELDSIDKKNLNIISYDAEKEEFTAIHNGETAVCNLGSINIGKYVKDGTLDVKKLHKNVALAVKFLDKVIDRNFYPTYEAKASNSRHRPVGLGIMGLQDFFFKMKIPFDSNEAIKWSAKIQEEIYYAALKTSCKLAKDLGKHADFEKSHAANGLLQFDLAKPLSELKDSMIEIFPKGTIIEDMTRWNALKEDIKENGLRNSLLIAIAPTVTIAAITASQECIEPQISNIFKTETLSGEFIRTNRYLVEDLKEIGLWNKVVADKIIMAEGSIQNIPEIPQNLKDLYKTVWEIKQRWLINHATVRSYFIDQSQSLNLFVENPKLETLSSMYMYLYEQDLKTSYYLRSKAATKINKSMTSDTQEVKNLENPETCESCT